MGEKSLHTRDRCSNDETYRRGWWEFIAHSRFVSQIRDRYLRRDRSCRKLKVMVFIVDAVPTRTE